MPEITVEQLFKEIMIKCNPRYNDFVNFCLVFDMFFGGKVKKEPNFIGGCGDKRRTTHEKIFSLLYPNLKQQVSFGTGKNGFKTYGATRYIVDFYDENDKSAYEIDGKGHARPYKQAVDNLKAHCLYHVHGITTYRISNKKVEEMLMNRLREIEKSGRLYEFAGGYRQDKSA